VAAVFFRHVRGYHRSLYQDYDDSLSVLRTDLRPTLSQPAADAGAAFFYIIAESDSIRYRRFVKTISVTEVARNFSSVLNQLEKDQEDVVLVRNNQKIARLIAEPPAQNALQVLGDLYRTIDDETAEALSKAVKLSRKGKNKTLGGLKNPWVS
jgi:PHD/YefM family antitoxin component YafN of YafNO toxin-antitoxin module